jgi:microcystin-dependent protein
MSTPFMAELRWISFNFAPKGWALANGQLMQINQNQALFALLGTTYGGNGQTTFALPDVRSRVVVGRGSNFSTLGERGGEEFHTITQSEMPQHNHFVGQSDANGGTSNPAGNLFGQFLNGYRSYDNLTTMLPATITNTGGSQPHENRQPYLVINCIIALQGIFPSQN